uniref:Uncharacterized protein n=1 Tax=Xiphophorus couchianus TaxID=32473 RepID=A0A3B5KLG1_9TELE
LETRERDATAYLKKHKIVELMDNMTSMLLFYRPALTMLGIKDININPEVQLAESVHVIVCFVMNRSASSFF